jgi:serine/threonine-protein kinase
VREEPVPPSHYVPDLPPDLERIVLKAMAKDLGSRYQSAEELRADLIRFGRGHPVAAAPVVPAMAAAAIDESPTVASRRPPTNAEQMWDEPPRRWGPVIAVVVGLGLLAAVIAFALFSAGTKPTDTSGSTVEVPDVVGHTFAEAQGELKGLGFKVSRRDELSDAPIDEVIKQSPEAGLLARKGRIVVLTVSSSQVSVPNVVGQTKEQAEASLTKRGLVYTPVEVDAPDKLPGTVISTTPVAGTKVPKGSMVTVTIAKAPQIPIPAVAGMDQAAAQTLLTNAGFSVSVTAQPHATIPAGKAIGTTPAAGTKVDKGTFIVLLVSTGPSTVAVPDVTNQQCQSGATTLQNAGFGVTINGTPSNPASLVASQSPPGGSMAAPGSTVTINCTL